MTPETQQDRARRVLIVEDDAAQLRTLTDLLEDEGFSVDVSQEVDDAIEKMETGEFSVAVVDLRLPGLNGIELLRRLRVGGVRTRVIIHTAFSSFRSARDAVNLGAFAYVEKLGDPRELIGHVHRAVEDYLAEELRESERQYRVLFESIHDGILIHDADGAVLHANEVSCARLGRTLDELKGKDIRELVTDEHARRVPEHVQRTTAEGTDRFETVFVSKSGQAIPCDVLEHAIEYAGQGAIMSVARDITERKQAEEALRESETRYRRLVEGSPDIVWAFSDRHGTLYASARVEAILGYSPDYLYKNPWLWHKSIHPDDQGLVTQAITGFGVAKPVDVEYRIKDSSGNWHWFHDRSIGRRVEGDETIMEGISADITERKQVEEQLRQSQKLEAIGQLAGGVAHDFNNMLTGIQGYVSFARKQVEPDSEPHSDLTETLALAKRAEDLTRQLLAFSRRQTLKPVVININSLVANVTKMLKRLIGEDIALDFLPASDLGNVEVDPGQIEQVLVNLAVNARDAMPKGGKLTIETDNARLDHTYADNHVGVKPGPYVMLAVTDTGCGMDRETSERIFEPFFTTKDVGQGTGLGLSTVYGIVKQHGGNIWVYSEPGKGTTVKIYLPTAIGEEDAVEEAAEEPAAGGTETILVVEDEVSVLDIATRILKARGYEVLSAGSPADAEKLVAEHQGEIALLLTDVVMPGASGRELYDALTSERPSLKVLYISGYTDDAVVRQGALKPDAPFLQKPFSPDVLVRKVREVLDERGTRNA